MTRDDVIVSLRAHQGEPHRRGVRHAALFGSVARGDARPDSDIDLLIGLDPAARIGVWEYVAITQYLSDLFPARADVANRARLKPLARPAMEREAVEAF